MGGWVAAAMFAGLIYINEQRAQKVWALYKLNPWKLRTRLTGDIRGGGYSELYFLYCTYKLDVLSLAVIQNNR